MALAQPQAKEEFLMEDEKVVESIPTETMESDDEFFNDIDNEVISEEGESSEEETNEDSEPSETQEDNSEDEKVDFKPLLEELSKKVKYNKENVSIESLEDLINGYQKGLNYDKIQEKLENLQNSKAETYIRNKADELGITVDEYMDQVEDYERQQKKKEKKKDLLKWQKMEYLKTLLKK